MLASALPNPELFKDQAPTILENQVIHTSTTGKYYYPAHTTPHLFIANFNNTGNYQLNGSPIYANDKFFYFLNSGDRLEINFKKNQQLETLLILFSDRFMVDWFRYEEAAPGGLLENAPINRWCEWSVPTIPFAYNASIRRQLNKIKSVRHEAEMEIALFELMESFRALKGDARLALNKIAAKKKSTREEIYRRLVTANVFMEDSFSTSPTIDMIASEVCLDKFHFLKLYKRFYGITPHQYVVKLKLEHARSLLVSGKYSVLEVCVLCGFESQGSFTNLFKRCYGQLPSHVRGYIEIM